ncbi:unnamed protein product [Bathycoccus prasinos]
MPDSLYELVEENANFAIRERTGTRTMHRNSETRRIPGDINTKLQHLGFSGIYWTTSYGFKCDQNSGECPLKKEANVLQTYGELKTEFENHACRVDDVLLYPVLDTKNERTLYTLLQLKERFYFLFYDFCFSE